MGMAALTDRSQRGICRTETDQRLVELARGGDVAAFEAIVLRYQEPGLPRGVSSCSGLTHASRCLHPRAREWAHTESLHAWSKQ